MTAARRYKHQAGQHQAAEPAHAVADMAQPATPETGRAALRARLLAVRDETLAQMAALVPLVDGGLLRLVADADRAIGLLDRIEAEA